MEPQVNDALDRAERALRDKDFMTAESLFKNLAAQGSQRAMLVLGVLYERGGNGVQQNYELSRLYYEEAMATGALGAARALGRIYFLGVGSQVDYERAFSYYTRLENSNSSVSLYRLGIIYELGCGTTRDTDHAAQCYARAAALGHIRAKKNLGVIKVRQGDVLNGFLLLATAIAQGVIISMRNPGDERLRTF